MNKHTLYFSNESLRSKEGLGGCVLANLERGHFPGCVERDMSAALYPPFSILLFAVLCFLFYLFSPYIPYTGYAPHIHLPLVCIHYFLRFFISVKGESYIILGTQYPNIDLVGRRSV